MTSIEHVAVYYLSRCRLLPGSFDKRFIRDMSALAIQGDDIARDALPLSPKQRQHLWRIAKKYYKQMPPAFLENIHAHCKVYEEHLAAPPARQGFEKALSLDPRDWTTRLVYADWLEEHGDEKLAAAQRWMTRLQRTPDFAPGGQSYGPELTYGCNFQWKWWLGYYAPSTNNSHALPPHLAHGAGAWHRTRMQAETGLADVLSREDELIEEHRRIFGITGIVKL